MSERPSPSDAPLAEPSAAQHYAAAAEHARRAADLLEKAQQRVVRGEHASGGELGRGACGHLGESYSHVAEAQRIGAHNAASVEGAQEQGSHWNDADPGDSVQQS